MKPNEVLASVEKIFEEYLCGISLYTDINFYKKPDENTWSLAEMYEHVTQSAQKFFLANVKRCLEERGGQIGGEKNKNGEGVFKYGGFPPMKIKMPEALNSVPIVPQSIDIYKTQIDIVLESARVFLPLVEANAGLYKTEHPVLGMLNAEEWYHNLEMHSRHHLAQKKFLESLVLV